MSQPTESPNRSLFLLSTSGLLAWLSYEMIRSPVLPLFATHLGIPPDQIGFVVAASTITGIFLKFPAGSLSDLYPKRYFLLFGASVFALLPFGYLWIVDPGPLLWIRFLHGMATAIFAPVALSVIASLFKERRAEGLSWYSSATMVGGLLGPMIGGLVVQTQGYSTAFAISGVFGLGALLLTILFSRRVPTGPPPASSAVWRQIGPRLLHGIREIACDGKVFITSSAQAVLYMALGTIQAFLPLYGLSVGLREAQVGLLFGAQMIVTVISKPLLGRWSDRIGRKPVILAGLVLSAAAIGAVPFSDTFGSLILVAASFGLGVALVTSSVSALVADLCQERHYGSAMGVFGTIMDVGHAAGPILAGILISRSGYTAAYGAAAVFLLLAAVTLAWKVRDPRDLPSENP